LSETFYSRSGKRYFDAAAALAGLAVLWPLFLVVAIAIKMTDRGPVFFRQTRVGQFGREFRILKFRSMLHERGSTGPLLTASGDERITTVGKWLRKTKIDELPQLLNVASGEMSLVGPRPEIPHYVALYTEGQKRVLEVKPGITGPSANVYEEELLAGEEDQESAYIHRILPPKLAIDCIYCDNVSFLGDLRLIFATFFKIFASFGSTGASAISSEKQIEKPLKT